MEKFIKIYGERNTSTNYLSQLIALNLNAQEISGIAPKHILSLQQKLPGKEIIRDLYFRYSFNINLGWKHSFVNKKKILAHKKYKSNQLGIITVTKNPYSWLLSLYRNPYHQYYLQKPNFINFLQTPWKTVMRDNLKVTPNNPVELWNLKNSSYIHDSFLNLTSECIIQNPKLIINTISKSFDIEKSHTHFRNYLVSTKDKQKNHDYYRDYYCKEKWRKELTDEEIAIINHSLDKKLMRHFSYKLLTSSLE